MDFFERQAAARRQSRWLLLAFSFSVVLVVAALTWVVLALFGSQSGMEAVYGGGAALHPIDYAARNPDLALSSALFWLLVILGASAWKGLLLRGGGGVVARSLGGTRIERGTQDAALRRLHNVVEEMAIASGIPMPQVYVLEGESGINAFAAGHSPANAAVAVTRGALDRLGREELQGVVAHEFSHILNGDMRLNIRLIGWLFGLLAIAIIGRTVLRLAPRGRRGAPAALGLGLAMMVLGYVGLACGRIIQAAVCRQRERLADASAVQFTRNPGGLRGALLQIAGLPSGGRLAAANCDEVAHLLFAPGIARLLSTHPPLGERIQALDPAFPLRQMDELAAEAVRAGERRMQAAVARDAALANDSATAAAGSNLAGAVAALAGAAAAGFPAPSQVSALVGHPGALHFGRARELRESLPDAIRNFGGSPAAARALVLATLLSPDATVQAAQLDAIEAGLGAGSRLDLAAATAVTSQLHPMQRLPAMQGLFPMLRRLPRDQRIALAAPDRDARRRRPQRRHVRVLPRPPRLQRPRRRARGARTAR